MELALILLVVAIVLTLIFDYINGFHDAANAIATVVSTKALSPMTAVIYGATLNLIGALMGTEVAATIGKGLVASETITIYTVLCTVIAAIVWNLITWYKGLPTSSSHAIIGSLLGATFFSSSTGWSSINGSAVMDKVIVPMLASPILGITIGFFLMWALTWLVYKLPLGKTNKVFSKLQIISAGFMALNHGQNDAQKSMGIIALAMVLTYPAQEFSVPLWVKLSCALAMCLGTMSGGWRIIRTLGSKMIKLQPIHGFAAETSAGLIIAVASHLGIPVSTTQVITTSIMGVGASKRLSAVKWGLVGNIVWAWVLTIPLTFLFSGVLMMIWRNFIH
jgi:PiT family inorganic phosphate transporter